MITHSPLWVRAVFGTQGWSARIGIALLSVAFAVLAVALTALRTSVLKPLPTPDLNNLVLVQELDRTTQQVMPRVSAQTLSAVAAAEGTRNVAAVQFADVTIVSGVTALSARAARVSQTLFELLSVHPVHGRLPAEPPAGFKEIVVTEAFWRKLGGTAENFERRTVLLDGGEVSVVGILPRWFRFPAGRDVWMLLNEGLLATMPPDARILLVIAKVDPGSRALVSAAANRMHPDPRYRNPAGRWRVTFSSLLDELAGPMRQPVVGVTIAAFMVVAVVLVNLISLWLAAFFQRLDTLAVMLALGATRMRMLVYVSAGTALWCLTAACAGAVLADWAIQALMTAWPESVGALRADGLLWAAMAMLGIAVAIGAFFGVIIGRQVSNEERLRRALRAGRGVVWRPRVARWLLAMQVAAALTLTCISLLLVRSMWRLQAEDPGFATRDVIATHLSAPRWKYESTQDAGRALTTILDATRRGLPRSVVAMTTTLPIGDSNPATVVSPGGSESSAADTRVFAFIDGVTPRYFEAMGIPLLAGREFSERDSSGAPPVVILDTRLAARLWPEDRGREALGRTVTVLRERRTVIGVVGSVKYHSLADRGTISGVYVPFAQWPQRAAAIVARAYALGDRSTLATEIRSTERDAPVSPVRSLEEIVSESLRTRRYYSLTAVSIAAVAIGALLLGLVGTVAQILSARRRELAIRLVLGASSGTLARETLARLALPLLVGIAAGAALLALVSTRLTPYLFGVQMLDVTALTFSLLVVIASVAIAITLAVRRWSGIDPQRLLMAE